jgi:hypothetical protein
VLGHVVEEFEMVNVHRTEGRQPAVPLSSRNFVKSFSG